MQVIIKIDDFTVFSKENNIKYFFFRKFFTILYVFLNIDFAGGIFSILLECVNKNGTRMEHLLSPNDTSFVVAKKQLGGLHAKRLENERGSIQIVTHKVYCVGLLCKE